MTLRPKRVSTMVHWALIVVSQFGIAAACLQVAIACHAAILAMSLVGSVAIALWYSRCPVTTALVLVSLYWGVIAAAVCMAFASAIWWWWVPAPFILRAALSGAYVGVLLAALITIRLQLQTRQSSR